MKGFLAICFVLLVVSAQYCVRANQDKFACTDTFISKLSPCGPFLNGKGKQPTQPCCAAIQEVGKLFQDKDKKQRAAVCNCVKNFAKKMNVKPDKAKQIPKSCKINVPIDPNFDCSKA